MSRKNKLPKTYGFFDTETYHIKDMEHDGIDVRVVGNTLHVFENGTDTGRKPTTYVKCASLITVDANTRERREIDLTTVEDILCAFVDNKVDRAYSHNYRFDGSFIISYLLERNNCAQLPNGWMVSHKRSLMGRRGVIYQDELEYVSIARNPVTHRHDKHTIQFRDSAKIWNSNLRSLGESFDIIKGDEALTAGVTPEVREYCMQDSRIIEKAIMWTIDKVAELTNGEVRDGYMTSASMAYNLALISLRNDRFKGNISKFNDFCSEYLPKVDTEHGFPAWMRKLYKGATPLLSKSFIKKLVRCLRVYDVNSMYPYQMATKRMPMCRPIKVSNPEDVLSSSRLWFARVSILADVKQGHRATFIDKEDSDTLVDRMDYTDGIHFAYITNEDFDLIKRDYDIEYIEVHEAYEMRSVTYLFKGFIDYWYDTKKNADTGALRAFAKLIINSLYGKFGTRTEMESAHYGWKNGVITIEADDEVNETKRAYYLPIAVWTTSYARNLISKACNILGWDNVIYTDTDSLHIINLTKEECERRLHEAGIGTSKTILGDFKDETKEKVLDGIYIRNKGYFHFWHETGKIEEIKMAGANEFPGFETADDVLTKPLIFIQRRGYRVHGGMLIVEKNTEVKDLNAKHTRFRFKGMTEEASLAKLNDECRRFTAQMYGHDEDMDAYLEDCDYEENDPYWKRHSTSAFIQKKWDDYKTYGVY